MTAKRGGDILPIGSILSGILEQGRIAHPPAQAAPRGKRVGGATKAEQKILDAAEAAYVEPTSEEIAFMARELVQCTLPHSDPGEAPHWSRTNGNVTLTIARTQFDARAGKLLGYPYGSLPRLILLWMTTEAVRTKERRLNLGGSYAEFLRALDLNNTGGVRGDRTRVREQMRRLFGASISFNQTLQENGREGDRFLNMNVARRAELWWEPKKPDQISLFDSWVELGEDFFEAITAAPVPVDVRALRALKRSPLALDLYAWATHKAFSVSQRGKAQRVLWHQLADQFGSGYADTADFKKKASEALRKIQAVYPGLKLETVTGGLLVLPTSRPVVLPKLPVKRLSKPRE